MIFKLYLLAIVALANNVYGSVQYCPGSSVPIKPPCSYIEEFDGCGIQCVGNNSFDLKAILTSISNKLPKYENRFKYLWLKNTVIEELPADVCSGLEFINFYANNTISLKRVHSEAFNGTQDIIQNVWIDNSPALTDRVTNDSDLFGAIRKLTYMKTLYIQHTNVSSLATRALLNMPLLNTVILHENQITTVASYAFNYLPSIKYVNLNGNPIQRVNSWAFAVGPAARAVSGVNFLIELTAESLTNSTFADRAFDSTQRSATLWPSGKSATRLPRDVYEGFLRANTTNIIHDDVVDCTDSINKWISDDYPDVWKELKCN